MSLSDEAQRPGDYHILVVDDQYDVCQSVCDLVKVDGYRVTGVCSGQDALEQLQMGPVDLVLTDLMMPEMNGWQLLRAVKQSYSHVPVVVFTGYISEQAEAMLTSEQAAGVLTKPFDHRRLTVVLKALLFPQNLGRPAEVVVVDSEGTSLRMMDQALSKRGLYVHPFREASQALVYIRGNPPDMFITELNLSGASGLDICQAVLSNPNTGQIPIIVTSAQPSREEVLRAIQLGVKGFVAKPFEAEGFGERAVQVLRQAGK